MNYSPGGATAKKTKSLHRDNVIAPSLRFFFFFFFELGIETRSDTASQRDLGGSADAQAAFAVARCWRSR
jgi:hypothetical protein